MLKICLAAKNNENQHFEINKYKIYSYTFLFSIFYFQRLKILTICAENYLHSTKINVTLYSHGDQRLFD